VPEPKRPVRYTAPRVIPWGINLAAPQQTNQSIPQRIPVMSYPDMFSPPDSIHQSDYFAVQSLPQSMPHLPLGTSPLDPYRSSYGNYRQPSNQYLYHMSPQMQYSHMPQSQPTNNANHMYNRHPSNTSNGMQYMSPMIRSQMMSQGGMIHHRVDRRGRSHSDIPKPTDDAGVRILSQSAPRRHSGADYYPYSNNNINNNNNNIGNSLANSKSSTTGWRSVQDLSKKSSPNANMMVGRRRNHSLGGGPKPNFGNGGQYVQKAVNNHYIGNGDIPSNMEQHSIDDSSASNSPAQSPCEWDDEMVFPLDTDEIPPDSQSQSKKNHMYYAQQQNDLYGFSKLHISNSGPGNNSIHGQSYKNNWSHSQANRNGPQYSYDAYHGSNHPHMYDGRVFTKSFGTYPINHPS
jgi:hypothetical protein